MHAKEGTSIFNHWAPCGDLKCQFLLNKQRKCGVKLFHIISTDLKIRPVLGNILKQLVLIKTRFNVECEDS